MTEEKSRWHLAQLNVASMKFPLEDPRMQDFVDALLPVNALADAAPGFVWRLQDDDGSATSIRMGEEDMLLVNMSVWESVQDLRHFITEGMHLAIMRRRGEWFKQMQRAHLVLWWVPAGEIPSLEQAAERLERIRIEGPTAEAFNLGQVFEPPD